MKKKKVVGVEKLAKDLCVLLNVRKNKGKDYIYIYIVATDC